MKYLNIFVAKSEFFIFTTISFTDAADKTSKKNIYK